MQNRERCGDDLKTLVAISACVILSAFAPCVLQEANANNQSCVNMPIAKKEIPTLSDKDKARFFSNFQIGEIDQCWNWQLAPSEFGYGFLKVGGRNGKNYLAHRISYSIFIGAFDWTLCVCHTCDNRMCVNPKHFFLGTETDNNKDRHAKGRSGAARGANAFATLHPERMCRGVNHVRAKLNDEKVREIRLAYPLSGDSLESIAAQYGVSKKTIFNVIHRRIWKHV